MLLETVDVKRNDVLIFSYNIFDFNENFRIVFKKDKIKRPYKISYEEVCDFVSEPCAKNIIVYRLLTNVNSLDVFGTKYGYFIRTLNGLELIYFDPIFAIKDLPNLKINLSDRSFRFKIQQVGFTTLTGATVEGDFREVFAWDMRAKEAQNQNDKVFADALFIFDENYVSDGKDFSLEERDMVNRQARNNFWGGNIKEEVNVTNNNIDIHKPNFDFYGKDVDIKELKKEMLKKALGIKTEASDTKKDQGFSSFLSKYRNEVNTGTLSDEDKGLNEFFNENSKKKIRDESVILRFTNEK
jgi:hypothetical protein